MAKKVRQKWLGILAKHDLEVPEGQHRTCEAEVARAFKSLCKTVCSEVSIWLPAYLAATGALPSGLGGFDICSARQAAKAAAGAEFGINSHPVARPVELCQALLAVQGSSELKLRRVASAPICLMLQVHACRCPCALSLHQS